MTRKQWLALCFGLITCAAACTTIPDATGPTTKALSPKGVGPRFSGGAACGFPEWWGDQIDYEYDTGLWRDMDRDNYYVNDPYTPCDSDEEPVLTETDLQALESAYEWYQQYDGPTFINYIFGHQTEWGNEASITDEQLAYDANGDAYDGMDWSGSNPCPECGPPVRLPNGRGGEENT